MNEAIISSLKYQRQLHQQGIREIDKQLKALTTETNFSKSVPTIQVAEAITKRNKKIKFQ